MSNALRIDEIPALVKEYLAKLQDEDAEIEAIMPRVKRDQKLRRDDLFIISRWKSGGRNLHHVAKNSSNTIETVSAKALRSHSEVERIESLLLLSGVAYPTASVVLHFFYDDVYPVLDFRAIASMSLAQPSQYSFDFWWDYVQTYRRLLAKARVKYPSLSPRDLDRALWQKSKGNDAKRRQC